MPEVVATTPSSPFGAWVTVDILPRKSAGIRCGPRRMERGIRNLLLYPKMVALSTQTPFNALLPGRILKCLLLYSGRACTPPAFLIVGVLHETLRPFTFHDTLRRWHHPRICRRGH